VGASAPATVAVLLAAGASSRWGAQGPKALAPVDGRPVLARVIECARRAGCDAVHLVVGSDAERIRSAPLPPVDRVVENPNWPAGQSSSALAGFRSVGPGAFALLWPVDVPFVAEETVRALRRSGSADGLALWWTPTYEGRGGHPILLSPQGVALAAALPDDLPLKDAPFRRGPGEVRVPVADPGVLDNTNYPRAFDEARRRWERRGGDRWTDE
jgi:CTP:molybdopterin cytidylyltransferase MocA